MELFTIRRWRLVVAQVVASCCVYKIANNRESSRMTITKFVLQLGQYEPSSPSTYLRAPWHCKQIHNHSPRLALFILEQLIVVLQSSHHVKWLNDTFEGIKRLSRQVSLSWSKWSHYQEIIRVLFTAHKGFFYEARLANLKERTIEIY